MIHVSQPFTTAPASFKTPLQQKTYQALETLGIPFQRVDTDEVITMEDCAAINRRLDMKMVKTLFLCDRKQTEFTLFVTAGDKPFQAREFAAKLGVSRLSFAPADRMKTVLGTQIGATTVFSALLDTAKAVRMVIDGDVARQKWYGCSDGTTTGYMKLKTNDVVERFLPFTGHRPVVIEV